MPFERYGINWVDGVSDIVLELDCFLRGTQSRGGHPDDKPFHFKQVVKILWGPKSKKHYVWDPWTDRMLERACDKKYLALAGSAGSRKSSFMAVWGLVNWLALADKTLILVASTSITEARRRIWGQVEEYFTAGCESMAGMQKGATLPGKVVGSLGKIRTEDAGKKFSDLCGVQLIAGDRSHEKDAMKKIGFHNQRVFMLLDELTDLSPTLVTAAKANLVVNPEFQLVGAGNFASIYDPLGEFAEPVDGWGSVDDTMDEWETKDGWCLRFDGLRSPNILLGQQKYPGQYGPQDLENHRKSLGEYSASFWRMCRSFPCPEADQDRVYSEADLLKGDVKSLVQWQSAPETCAALDPAFVNGGDKAMAYFGKVGLAVGGKQTLQVERKELREDIRKKDENKALQIAKLFRDECLTRGIPPERAAYDASGGGVVMDALFHELWNNKLLGVQFGGAASERPASVKDSTPARKKFKNRVTEIWFAGLDFIQAGQIKGLPSETCVELVERRKARRNNVTDQNRVESKDEMKKRTAGRSPDDADAFLILLELARVRLSFRATGMEGKRGESHGNWNRQRMLSNRVWKNSNYRTPEAMAA